ncbi:hypothetical protein QJQ45_005263 [Haematococcus lacustris]|nr:hypothetical protein QJQ45_005263 [Haematococcus lacustris]
MRAQSPSVCPANSSSLRKTVARPCSAPVVLRDAPAAAVYNAFGLMELQRGNWLAALMLLERSVRIEPRLQPVLNWALVDAARQAVGSRQQRRRKEPEGAAGSMPDTTPCSS